MPKHMVATKKTKKLSKTSSKKKKAPKKVGPMTKARPKNVYQKKNTRG
jgi:hypothetical protein